MIQEVRAYKADDGTIWTTEEMAMHHNLNCAWAKLTDETNQVFGYGEALNALNRKDYLGVWKLLLPFRAKLKTFNRLLNEIDLKVSEAEQEKTND